MSGFGKFLLFFSSWFPAYAMVGLISLDGHKRMPYLAFGITVVSIAVYFFMERIIFARGPRSLKILEISRKDENILMYVIAYLPPFFSVDYAKIGHLLALCLFYVIFSITYVMLDLYYLNPMFVLRGYRTYAIKADGSETEYTALIKRDHVPKVGDTVHYRGRDRVLLINEE
jgi:hypothetical protein